MYWAVLSYLLPNLFQQTSHFASLRTVSFFGNLSTSVVLRTDRYLSVWKQLRLHATCLWWCMLSIWGTFYRMHQNVWKLLLVCSQKLVPKSHFKIPLAYHKPLYVGIHCIVDLLRWRRKSLFPTIWWHEREPRRVEEDFLMNRSLLRTDYWCFYR
jgi:hypothetical protein